MRALAVVFAALILMPADARAIEFSFVLAGEPVLSNPHDVELSRDGKRLYVSDLGHDRIAVLDAETLALKGTFGEGDNLSQPHDVHLGPDGRLYVADTGGSRIAIYQPDGDGAKMVGELKGRIRRPEGVFAHADGRVYATGAASGNIVAFENGKVVREADDLRSPHDVIATRDGHLWVADAGNDRMLLMTRDLEVVKTLAGSPYDFSGPRYQDMTDDGVLVVADKYSHSIKAISADGTLLKVLGTGKAGKEPGQFTTPEGVVIRGPDVWFADSGNDRIVRYRMTP